MTTTPISCTRDLDFAPRSGSRHVVTQSYKIRRYQMAGLLFKGLSKKVYQMTGQVSQPDDRGWSGDGLQIDNESGSFPNPL